MFKWLFAIVGTFFFLVLILAVLFMTLFNVVEGTYGAGAPGGGDTTVVQAAKDLAAHLHGERANLYTDANGVVESGFPMQVLDYWNRICGGCSEMQSGTLQCVMFVLGAYALAGEPLTVWGNAQDFWPRYANQKEWVEVPAGKGLPSPGDIMVWRGGPYGHVAVVIDVQAPTALKDGLVTFAEANAPGPIETEHITPTMQVVTWPGYTVLGFIHSLKAPALHVPTMPAGMPNSQWVAVAWQDAIDAGIPPDYFVRQINTESGFNPQAVGPSVVVNGQRTNAVGIAQFLPSTAAAMQPPVNPYDPVSALKGAAQMMKQEAIRYQWDYPKALAGYNAGDGNVDRAVASCNLHWISCMPSETQNYVLSIIHS